MDNVAANRGRPGTVATMRRGAFLRAAAVAAAAALTLGACGKAGEDATPVGPAGADEAAQIPEGLADFYTQEIDWKKCEPSGATCAEMTVPLDYSDPTGETIELFVKRSAEPKNSLGALFLNPGGPGGEAASMVDKAGAFVSQAVQDSYQLVAVDPRGVGRSTPIDCLSDAELDIVLAGTYDTSTPDGVDAYLQEVGRIADACVQTTGTELLANMSTENTARDFDLVRGALGQGRLNYLGYSYGTFLGGMYAHLFPQNVGRMVLDGGLDPTVGSSEVVLGQATGFENALAQWASKCVSGQGCPVSGTPQQAVVQVRELLEEIEETPLPTTSGRSLTGSLAAMGVIVPLYSELSWPSLTQALTQAFAGDGTGLLQLADLGSGRLEDGTYRSNSQEALWAVNCRDYPVDGDRAQWEQRARELTEAAPTFGPALTYTEGLCDAWPEEASPQGPVEPLTAPNAAPILVIGTTEDPATPYEWSESLAAQLGGEARLLTVNAISHTAYHGAASKCVRETVDRYLMEGVVPAEGASC